MSHAYKFTTSGDADSWQTVQRLAGEAGWSLSFDDAAVAALRAEFIASLYRDAGIEPSRMGAGA